MLIEITIKIVDLVLIILMVTLIGLMYITEINSMIQDKFQSHKFHSKFKKDILNVINLILLNEIVYECNFPSKTIIATYEEDKKYLTTFILSLNKKNCIICNGIKIRINKIKYEELLLKVL
jgi:hypothetical protein